MKHENPDRTKLTETPSAPIVADKQYHLLSNLGYDGFIEFLKDYHEINDNTLRDYFKKKSWGYISKIHSEIREYNLDPYRSIHVIITYQKNFDLALKGLMNFYAVMVKKQNNHSNWEGFVMKNNLDSKSEYCNDEWFEKFISRQERSMGIAKRYLSLYAWNQFALKDMKSMQMGVFRTTKEIEELSKPLLLYLKENLAINESVVEKKPTTIALAFKTFFLQKANRLAWFGACKKDVVKYGKSLGISGDNFYNHYRVIVKVKSFNNRAYQDAITESITLLGNDSEAVKIANSFILSNH